ncbi:uncharacterized protein LOC121387708 [Gigantopelta aegis]|uniref:uncharacterized protein LOC121387708 n=1 Tax=Gigantopelta aegis TaxID=1735272 RepID=UPI001B88B854|nr:uncharacterized protein LOC121387708 [Gigantopelta aegis]
MAYSWKPQKYAKLNLPVVSATYGMDFASDIEYVEVKNEVKQKSFEYGLGKNNQDISHLKEGYYHMEKKYAKLDLSTPSYAMGFASDHVKDVKVKDEVKKKISDHGLEKTATNMLHFEEGDCRKRYTKPTLPIIYIPTPTYAVDFASDHECHVKVKDEVKHGLDLLQKEKKLNVQQYNDHPKAPVEEGLPLDTYDPKELLRPLYNSYIKSTVSCKIKNVQTFEEWYTSLSSATLLKKEKKSNVNTPKERKPKHRWTAS